MLFVAFACKNSGLGRRSDSNAVGVNVLAGQDRWPCSRDVFQLSRCNVFLSLARAMMLSLLNDGAACLLRRDLFVRDHAALV